ncbi:MAG: GDSL-type esterase/lipase family protein [Limnobacter sp.]|uniref:GDSL-type esterase/lipase family protein n=1 Tax=Limnobacter sp. TaxID=2003368 RepID=UPI0039192DCD
MLRPLLLTLSLLLCACMEGQNPDGASSPVRTGPAQADLAWVPVWGTAVQAAYPIGFPVDPKQQDTGGTLSPYFLPTVAGVSLSYPLLAVFPGNRATNQTLRQIVRPTVAANTMRLVLSNKFGDKPLQLQDVFVGLKGEGPSVVAGSNVRITFNGATQFVIPAGETLTSDTFILPVLPSQALAISLFIPKTSGLLSWHASSLMTSYATDPNQGNHAESTDGKLFTNPMGSWFLIDRLEAQVTDGVESTVAVLGDSITDGVYASFDANNRWTDVLSNRLVQAYGNRISVTNAGIGGNMLLLDSPQSKSGRTRLQEDLLTMPNVKWVIVSLGINDVNFARTAPEIIKGLEDLATKIRQAGKVPIASTLGPTYVLVATNTRLKVNEWIRTSGVYSHVLDFDAVLRDDTNPLFYKQAFASGDNLHPNKDGFKAMGESIDLRVFE